jgi:hypothetical protein
MPEAPSRAPRRCRSLAAVAVAVATALLAACGGGPAAPSEQPAIATTSATIAPKSTATPEPSTPGAPTGLLAIGHSGINSDNVIGGRNLSWATSTLPAVNSVYLRLLAAAPETGSLVANTGLGGSKAAALRGQAVAGLRRVPAPRLVLIYSFENDIRCADDETPYVTAYGEALRQALDFVVETSPQSEILVVGSIGRPAGYAALFADRPEIRALLGGPGRCDLFDPTGELVPSHVKRLTTMLELYEAEIGRVCGTYSQCHTDEGALADEWTDDIGDFLGDWGHYNARGNAKVAAIIWPKVAEILGLPA